MTEPTDILSALWTAGGGSVGGMAVTILLLKLMGVDLLKREKRQPQPPAVQCPMPPGLATLERKIDQLIKEQVRSNTYLEVMATAAQHS